MSPSDDSLFAQTQGKKHCTKALFIFLMKKIINRIIIEYGPNDMYVFSKRCTAVEKPFFVCVSFYLVLLH